MATKTHLAPNWRHVGAFLGLTFGLTWLVDLAIFMHGGLDTPGITTVLQLQMLLPAFSAIVLGLFLFRQSPIYRGRPAGRGRWFYYYFLLLTLIYVLGALGVWLAPAEGTIAVVRRIGAEFHSLNRVGHRVDRCPLRTGSMMSMDSPLVPACSSPSMQLCWY
jgi:hypothetical protein